MDLEASLALYARGREAWNAWALSMIDRRRALVASGQWAWERDYRTDIYGTNKETQTWRQDAAAQFSYHEFAEAPDFSGFVFPGIGSFVATKFQRGACFRAARFRDGSCFNFARFGGPVEFNDAEFCSRAEFSDTHFLGDAFFIGCRFIKAEFEPTSNGQLDCSDAKFAMSATFAEMRCGHAVLSNTEFARDVSFEGATVDELFFLYNTIFRGDVILRGAHFINEVDFTDATLGGSVIR